MSTKLDVPVTLIFFNRPDTLEKVFEAVREARPEKLYLVCDGPRADRPDDIGKVIACRQLAENVDWPCKVEKIYAAANMGCKERVHTGISAVLEKEECTIILEDDVVPVPDFFTYCRDMLEAYKNDRRVMMISGTNLVRDHKINGPYCFSCFSSIWGWLPGAGPGACTIRMLRTGRRSTGAVVSGGYTAVHISTQNVI